MMSTSITNGTRHGVKEMAEAQRDRYEALTDNFAALQRRNVEFAQGGLEFLKFQESNARAAQQWWTSGLRLLQTQQRSAGFAQNWMRDGIGIMRQQPSTTGARLRYSPRASRSSRKVSAS